MNISLNLDLYTIAVWVIVGLVAGLVSSRLMLGHGLGIVADIAVGIIGAFVGNFLANYFGVQVVVPGHAIVTQILIALFGSLILLLVLRVFGMARQPGRRRPA
ncbi:MAG: GlsB/YeaQ/YmgE family stress response membrane protein [Candidatus Dormibacteraeota bacterium]|nr:GlsB/YeaQ/YmgE family stress response membrane protein [Candidatus Dormibacteraeota bacterium]